MSQDENRVESRDRSKNYRIDIGAYGSIGIEAPTKDEAWSCSRKLPEPNGTQA